MPHAGALRPINEIDDIGLLHTSASHVVVDDDDDGHALLPGMQSSSSRRGCMYAGRSGPTSYS